MTVYFEDEYALTSEAYAHVLSALKGNTMSYIVKAWDSNQKVHCDTLEHATKLAHEGAKLTTMYVYENGTLIAVYEPKY